MDTQQLKDGLGRLADEAEPAVIDVRAVIATAKTRKARRYGVVATGLVVIVLAVGVVVIVNRPANRAGLVAPARPAFSTEHPVPPSGGAAPADDRSRKFDNQLASANLIPSGYTVQRDPNFGDRQPLKFTTSSDSPGGYTAEAQLKTAQGVAMIQIWVLKQRPGLPFGHFYGQVFGPCTVGQDVNCSHTTLPDGTVAATQMDARPPAITLSNTLSALRPDGTYIQVITNVQNGLPPDMPTPPLTRDQLLKFATAFTW